MTKVDPHAHGGGEQRPKLTPEVLGNAEFAVLTIKEARTGLPTADGRQSAFLTFAEVEPDEVGRDYVLWLNKSDIVVLMDRLGDDDDDWVTQQVPLQKVRAQNPKTGGFVNKYHVVSDTEWDEAMDEYASRRGGRTRGTKAKARKTKTARTAGARKRTRRR